MGHQDQCFYDPIVPSLPPGDEWVESVVMEINHCSLPWLALVLVDSLPFQCVGVPD